MSLTPERAPESSQTANENNNIVIADTIVMEKVEGCNMTKYFTKFTKEIQEMPVRNDDIFVCSYSKCGSTWTQEMVWCLANNLDFEKAKKSTLFERFPYLELSALVDFTDKPDYLEMPDGDVYSDPDSLNKIKEHPGPRFIKSHLPLQLLPRGLRDQNRLAKIIYVARDPRDVCVSFYHHLRIVVGFKTEFHTFVKQFMAGELIFAPFWDHVLNFWNIRHQPNVLFITYEEMKEDLGSVIRKASNFLGKSYTEEQLETLKNHLSFESMRKNNSVNYNTFFDKKKKEGSVKEGEFFLRSGKSGQFLRELDEEEIAAFNEWCDSALKGTDYKLPKY